MQHHPWQDDRFFKNGAYISCKMGLWPCVPVWGCLVCARAKSLPKLSPSFSSLSSPLPCQNWCTRSEKNPLLTWTGGVLRPEPIVIKQFHPKAGAEKGLRRCSAAAQSTCRIFPSYKHFPPTLQIKGRWESNINVWFLLLYSQKLNCYFQNYNVLSPISYPHISVRGLHISRIGLLILLQGNMWTDPGNT